MLHTTDAAEARRALLAKYLRGGLAQETRDAIPCHASDEPAPLSFGQQQLWLLAQLVPAEPVYNECVTIHLPGPLDIAVFERSFNEIIRRHEAWRTSFPVVDGQPVQRVHPPVPVTLPVVDLCSLPASEREAEALRLATEDARILFDMAQGPLLRAKLIRLSEQEHCLFLTLHHIIFDGVAIYQVFLPELRAVYEAFLADQPSPLPPVAVKYTDYAWWQREWLEKEVFADQMAYWHQQLAGVTAALELPTDRPRPAVETYHGSMFPFSLSKELTNALQTLAGQEGATLYMVLVTAFKTLLYRYTGQEDMLVGTATAGRKRAQLERLMGFCLSTVVLRTDLSGDPPFRELLKRVREVVAVACANDDVPFEYVVKELQPDRYLDHNPLFQVLMTLEPPLPVLASGWTLTQMDVKTGTSKFDLSLELDNRPEGLIGRFEFNTDLFDESTIARLISHWKTLLEGIVADPTRRLSELPLLLPTEYHQLLEAWNATQADYPRQKCLHQLFEEQVVQTPDALAVIFAQTQLTYRELNERANRLAHRLIEIGVGPDALVGLCVERSLEMIVGMLAILKAGGAYVPLDPTYPTERLSYMLEDSRTPVLVTQRHLVERLAPRDIQLLCMDRDTDELVRQPAANPRVLVASDQLAYVIYTSGSTGRPKGVQIPHRAVVNFLTSMRQEPGLRAEDTLLAVTTLSFDIAALELFLPLLVGARLVIAGSEIVTDGAALAEVLSRQHVTVMQATPVTWRLLLATGWSGDVSLKVLCGGEALPLDLARELLPKVGSLWNMYGPTETTIWSSVCEIRPDDEQITVGRPIANTQLYILDRQMQPVPVGIPGELYIGGDGLARGYLNRPELTRERFVEHPFCKDARLYRTGDLARYQVDGTVEIIGRTDHQIKIRGFRIEPGEIEAVLNQHPAVQECVVVAREDVPGDKRLVAYAILQERQALVGADLQSYVVNYVPNYMVPSAVMLLDAFPLTPNGKVNRRALPAPDYAVSGRAEDMVAPRTPLEEMVARACAQALSIASLSINDNFFMLGGHSLLAMQVVAQLRAALQVELTLRNFFEAPTVAQLARRIDQLRQSESSSSLLPTIQAAAREQNLLRTATSSGAQQESAAEQIIVIPASSNQQGLWLVDQFVPESAAYNIPIVLRLHARLNMAALEQSLQALVQRHEVLRTTFTFRDEQLMQVIAPTMDVSPTVMNVENLPQEMREAEVQRLASREAQRPFDLARGPLLRTTVIQLGPEVSIVLVVMHHIISDGWSIGVLCQELTSLYTACSTRRAAPLAALPIQYADFALWQREQKKEERLAAQLAYWQQRLADAPPVLDLPLDHPRPPILTCRGQMYSFTLPLALTQGLKRLSLQEGVTLYVTLMAAFNVLLHRYNGQDDLLIGFATAGREQQETHNLIGYFINTLVLRSDLSGNPTVREVLNRVRETVLEAQAHQDVPFERLVQEMQAQRPMSTVPLIQVLLTLNPPLPALPAPWELPQMDLGTGTAKFDLSLMLEDRPEGLVGWFEYSTDLFDATTIERMAGHWQTLVQAIVAAPGQHLSELPLLTETERQQLLVEWNATQTIYPKDMCIHQLFEAQVEHTPDALAVMFEEKQLTYGDLYRQANQLAHRLQQLGVGPEVPVGLCMDRSLEMVVGLLGILKAGGAYVPMDPAYPHERLAFMMEDAQVSVLVTQHSLLAQLPQHDAAVVCLDINEPSLAQQSTMNPISAVVPDQLAYVIYTSGSTGRPKGVQICHRAVVNLLTSVCQQPGMSREDTLLAVTTLSFDIAAVDFFLPLLVGARLIIAGSDIVTDGTALAEVLARTHTTIMQATPVTWHLLLASGWQGNASLKVLSTGEALPLGLARQLLPRVGSLWNMYGPTETTIWSSGCEIRPEHEQIPIGRPIANTQLYILDRQMQPVPVGIPGELYIGGDGLARGYLNRPELTRERFVEHPFCKDARLYRTGDLARYQVDGTVEIIGRADHQIKIRGFRIEPGEIEAVLNQHPAVQECVVVAREDVPGDKRLVAYVVAHWEKKVSVDELQNHIMKQLPSYMVPSTFEVLEALPRTPNGKVDRRALPTPRFARPAEEEILTTPTLPLHYQLITIWEELLEARPIGIRDNFFYLGGHSLLAAHLVARIEQVFGKRVPLTTLFAGATIEHLANFLQGQEDTELYAPLVAVQTGGSRRPIFFLHGDYKGGAFYCIALARGLGSDQPFYALKPCKFDGLQIPPTLEAMAAAHIELIRSVQPEGPYLLGGFCNGGLVAYEIARQLHTSGQATDLLVLINPTPVGYLRFARTLTNCAGNLMRLSLDKQLLSFLWPRHIYRYLQHVYRYMRFPRYRRLQIRLDPEQGNQNGGVILTLKALYELWLSYGTGDAETDKQVESEAQGDKRDFALSDLKLASIFPDPVFPTAEALRHDWEGIFHWTASEYAPGFYPGKSTFFFSWDWHGEEQYPANKKWRKVAKDKDKEVEIQTIAGTHDSCKTDYLHDLVEHLRMCLNKTQGIEEEQKIVTRP